MAGKSDYFEKKVLDAATGKTSYTSPTNTYMALCTVVPTDADTGSTITEVSYTTYARMQIAPADMTAAAGTTAETHNSAQKTFAAVTAGGPTTAIGFAICDAVTAGNVLYWGTLSSVTMSTTQTPPTLAASALSLTED